MDRQTDAMRALLLLGSLLVSLESALLVRAVGTGGLCWVALGVPVTSLASACDLLVQVTKSLCGKVRSAQKAQKEERDTKACGY